MQAEKLYSLGETVYWDENDVVWSGRVMGQDERTVMVWTRGGYPRWVLLERVRRTPRSLPAAVEPVVPGVQDQ